MNFELVNEWKEKELEKTIESFEEFLKQYDLFLEEGSEIIDKHNYKRYHALNELNLLEKDNSELTDKEKESISIIVEDINRKYEDYYLRYNNFKKNNSYYYTLQSKLLYLRNKLNNNTQKTIDNAVEVFKKDIDKHFNKLQAKVENKIGTILEIYHLGGYDYKFKGELSSCKVEVILAGGYNIQRLHTRWIVKNK